MQHINFIYVAFLIFLFYNYAVANGIKYAKDVRNMSFETYKSFFEDYEDGITVRPQKTAEFNFSTELKTDKKYRLFVVGETAMHYLWKNEPDTPYLYRLITDALDSENANQDHFCLDLSCKTEKNYIKRVYKKVLWRPVLSYLGMAIVPEQWKSGLSVKAENLRISDNGFLRMRVDVRLKKDGVSRHSVHASPDKTYIINIPEGTYDWQKLARDIEIPFDTANVCVFVEGKSYSGKVWVERPILFGENQNLLPDFAPTVTDREKFEWTAQYLSRKEWPEFEVKLNGETIFCDEVFERCHTCSEWEIALPKKHLKENNKLEIKLISDYHDTLPYCIKELGIIEQPDAPVSIISTSNVGVANGKAYVLLHINKPCTLKLEYLNENLSGKTEYIFDEAGYHGISIDCKNPCSNAEFKIICDKTVINGNIDRIVIKENDNVIAGTGDMVYIAQDLDYMMEFLAWYVSNNIGNFLTFRPIYRWCGTKIINHECWKPFIKVLNELGMKYVIICDGRELPGLNANPGDELLEGEGYLGRQAHENDGAIFYWWQRGVKNEPAEEQWHDLCLMAFNEDPEHSNCRFSPASYINDGEVLKRYINKDYPRDMKFAEKYTSDQLRAITNGETRHTGPSVLFKAFKNAGYDWVGAETMYSTFEPQMAFLRGFCKANDMDSFGVHHALQWSSSPFDDIQHSDRYRLALYLSYMLGVTDINTEEGLWRMEEYFLHPHRFTEACKEHLKQHQDFYNYIKTHTRSGEFYTPFAFVNGKHDGFTLFALDNMWGWEQTPSTCAEISWHELLKIIYPLSRPQEVLYRHGLKDCKKPVGYFTGTPEGNADVVPIESTVEKFSAYKLLVFAGYNMCESEEAEKLLDYVKQGGKVILTRAHLTNTTDYEKIRNFDMTFENHAFSFAEGTPEFKDNICLNPTPCDEVLETTADGLPLVMKYKIGKGEVILFNTKVYPAHESIWNIYKKLVEAEIKKATQTENVWTETGLDMGTAVYKQADGSTHVYFLAVDWYNGRDGIRNGKLLVGNKAYEVSLPFGVMTKAVVKDRLAVWPLSESGEVIKIDSNKAIVQGKGLVEFTLAKDGLTKTTTIDFTQNPVAEIVF